ncbi:MAG: peptidoglycan DD-metalloendopeptidase family protein [Desulfuromonadaceae bacterium]|nr:peptidoglycan DD-metalloendopeptidase family protein [Desulfuromonadaceae bacterium]
MNKRVHIIITGDHGRSHSLVVRRGRLRFAAMAGGVLLVGLLASVYFAVGSFQQRHQLSDLQQLVDQLASHNRQLQAQVSRQQAEQETLLSTTVSQLNEKRSLIEALLDKVGISIPGNSEGENSGGPFIEMSADTPEEALLLSDQVIEQVAQIPLGVPTEGYLSSGFGRRRDPLNGRYAFHSGIDIAHYIGTKVHATAEGIVVECGNVPGYGKVVKIRHGDRFTTLFGHLDKIRVKRGSQVVRGDVIGTMGNSGRSTGPHLHYEIHDQGRPINPYGLTYLNR